MSETETNEAPEPKRPVSGKRRKSQLLTGGLLCALLGGSLFPLLSWQRTGVQRAESLSNIRRIGQGALFYAQDWDSRLMPPATRSDDSQWLTWPRTLRPYVSGADTVFSNPANPITPFHSDVKHPTQGYPIDSSFALNRRFWGAFSSGPFPTANLEMPEQTVLFVEAGPLWGEPRRELTQSRLALLDYGDMLDRVSGLVPYPSTHDGRMAVIAADGHGLMITVEHYNSNDGPHDPLFGRIGPSMYNWNGGHPNGETDSPPRD